MRKPVIAGNWKMNMTNSEAVEMIVNLKPLIEGVEDVDIVVGPTYTALSVVGELIKGSNIQLSAQNMHAAASGAYTGEISSSMLLSCACTWVILGHSERRQYFGCTDEMVNEKVKVAADAGLKPIVCIGETLEERETEKTLDVLNKQLSIGLKDLQASQLEKITIAYEPVWAIGTGKTATPEQAEDAHAFIRNKVSEMYGEEFAQSVRILYGGSVKPDNVKEIMSKENVDGGLIGGASLKPESFAALVNYKTT